MRALELDIGGRQAQGFVDHQVGHQGADPGDGDVGVKPQDLLQGVEDAEQHHEQRDGDVEHQPHHAARMAVGDAGKEVRPGQGAGVSVVRLILICETMTNSTIAPSAHSGEENT